MEFNIAFTKSELCAFLIQKGVEIDDAKKLEEEKIDGETFQDISESDLREIGVKLGTRKKILKIINSFKQPILENIELQDLQIIGGDSNLSNSLVFDLVASGSSCSVIPTVSSTTALSSSVTTTSSSSSTATKVPAFRRIRPKLATKKKPSHTSSFLAEILPERMKTSIADLCTEDASVNALSTYADPKNINVLAMLHEHTSGQAILNNLKNGKGICRSDISEIVRIVVRAMIDHLRTLYPTSTQKHNLAKAIVRDIPELKSNREGVLGYEQFYDPNNNSGSIEWRLKTLRVRVPASIKKKKRKKDTKAPEVIQEEEIIIDHEALQKVNWLKLQPVFEAMKGDIVKGMEETFHIRRNYIMKRNPSIADILEEFPKLKEFDGELIDADFKLLYPNATNLLDVLPEYSQKIRIYASQKRQDIVERIGHVADLNLKAMMYLADLLPIPGWRKRKSRNPSPLPAESLCHPSESILTFTGENSELCQEDLAKHPRLLCCGEVEDEQLQFFLILDKEYVDLGKCFIKAFDILFKSYKVFNVEYPKNLEIFYSFIDTMIYKVNTGVVRSSVEHLNNIICCVDTQV